MPIAAAIIAAQRLPFRSRDAPKPIEKAAPAAMAPRIGSCIARPRINSAGIAGTLNPASRQ